MQIEAFVDDNPEQTFFDENTDASEDRTIGDATQESQLLCHVGCQAGFNPHFKRLTLPESQHGLHGLFVRLLPLHCMRDACRVPRRGVYIARADCKRAGPLKWVSPLKR